MPGPPAGLKPLDRPRTEAAAAGSTISRRELPPSAAIETWPAHDGWPLRMLRLPRSAPFVGTLLFLGGRADFVEKYLESYVEWAAWGYDLVAFDWRGQGGSGRLGDHRHKGHVDDFAPWLSDLGELIARLRRDAQPLHAVAHSMGGNLLFRYLAAGGGATIDRVVALAPMFGIAGMHPRVMGPVASAMRGTGRGGRYGWGQQPYGAFQQSRARATRLTGCADRFADEHRWVAEKPELALGGVTWGWLDAALRSCAELARPGVLEAIGTPALILMPGGERLVDPAAAVRAARRLPHGRLETVPGAGHELLREVNSIREGAQARIRDFLLGGAA